MGSITLIIIIGHKIYYKGIGVLRGQQHIPSEKRPKGPPPWESEKGWGVLDGCPPFVRDWPSHKCDSPVLLN